MSTKERAAYAVSVAKRGDFEHAERVKAQHEDAVRQQALNLEAWWPLGGRQASAFLKRYHGV